MCVRRGEGAGMGERGKEKEVKEIMENHLEVGKLLHRLKQSGNYQSECIVHSEMQDFFPLVAALGPLAPAQAPLVVASGGCSLLQCTGFSLWWLFLLPSTGPRARGLQESPLESLRALELP